MAANTAAHTPTAQTSPESPAPQPALPSFEEVYKAYFQFVWTSARGLGVSPSRIEDVVQEVFVAIHARLHTLRQPESLRSWIYGVVRRTVSGHRRSLKTKTIWTEGHLPEESLESETLTPLEQVEQSDQLKLFGELIGALDEAKREVFLLAELEEMPVPEIARALDVPLNTVYSRLRAARQLFQQAFARHNAREKRTS